MPKTLTFSDQFGIELPNADDAINDDHDSTYNPDSDDDDDSYDDASLDTGYDSDSSSSNSSSNDSGGEDNSYMDDDDYHLP